VNKTKFIVVAVIAIAVLSYITLDLGKYLTLEYAQSQLSSIQDYKNENFAQTALLYFAGYVIATSLHTRGYHYHAARRRHFWCVLGNFAGFLR